MKKYCKFCGKKLTVEQRHNIYCCSQCAIEDKKQKKIAQWQRGELVNNSQSGQIPHFIRNYMLQKANYKCEICGWNKINPITQLCPLEIHHIDGDYRNNQENNLQVLCPNCHSLTDNYKALNRNGRKDRITQNNRKNYCIDCGVEISGDALRCRSCSNKQRITEKPITREELKQKIRNIPFTTIAKEFNVSDNAIRKWCKQMNLPFRTKDIKQYSDEEWEKI